jgi:hypothetical protein
MRSLWRWTCHAGSYRALDQTVARPPDCLFYQNWQACCEAQPRVAKRLPACAPGDEASRAYMRNVIFAGSWVGFIGPRIAGSCLLI